uniref:Uncharacterized protein n=1 Tax=Tanacetum cinerariifolium TaxID=118510 RepID=A0A6L2MKM0_TANCI|nr:hypothetical protein [Tanacetum cinerariifolium]
MKLLRVVVELLRVTVEPKMLFYKNRINPKPVMLIFLWKEERVGLLISSPGGSSTPSFSPGTSSTPISSPTPSTPPIHYGGSPSNTECSNCKLLLRRIKASGYSTKGGDAKKADVQAGGRDNILTTQEYVKKVNKDVSEDDHFMEGPWLSAIVHLHEQGVIASGCLGDVDKFLKREA